jgi:uncharacterized protein (TIGR03437 family)
VSPAPLAAASQVRFQVGTVAAEVAFAGIVSAGVYQFNVVIPQVAEGDHEVIAEITGLSSRGLSGWGARIPVGN